MLTFRFVLSSTLAACLVGGSPWGQQASSQGLPPILEGDITVRLSTVAAFDPTFPPNPVMELTPTDLIPFSDGTGRKMLATLGGTIRVMDSDDNLLPAPLLTTLQTGLTLQQESGMTGIALHPDFAAPDTFGFGKLYTITTEDTGTAVADFGAAGAHQDVVREWDISGVVSNAGVNTLPAVTVADSREILRIDQPGPFHNLVDLVFSPVDEKLYLSLGDGGANSSQSQDTSSIFGNILRIDPNPQGDGLLSANGQYRVPSDNPFVGDGDALDEIYAFGLRSPFRMTFDRQTGDMYVGDVGAGSREEVNLITAGGNFGWPNREGTLGSQPPGGSIDPIFEYGRSEGRTVIGGFVYRGSEIPELVGKYVFAEFGQGRVSARLFYGVIDPEDPQFGQIFEFMTDPLGDIFPVDGDGSLAPLPDRIFSIGEDADGELFLVAGEDPRAVVPSAPGAFIVKLTESNFLLGDVNLDGIVSGDGFGDPAEDDLAAMIAGWGTILPTDTPIERWQKGDMNQDGRTSLADFSILREALLAQGLVVPAIEQLLGGRQVPEPAAVTLAATLAVGVGMWRRFRPA